MRAATVLLLLFEISVSGVRAQNGDPVIPPAPKATCEEIDPLPIPLIEARILNGTVRRGIPVSVGTPSQTLLLDIFPDFNFTHLVASSDACDRGSSCFSSAGGTYNSKDSSTVSVKSEKDALFIDTFSISNPSINLGNDYPIITANHEEEPYSGLGLGRASTLINSLINKKLVDSNVWSLDWGYEGNQIRNGELVVGGANEARFDPSGPSLEREFNSLQGCSLSIDVENNLVGDESVGGEKYAACIQPSFPALAIPRAVFEGFNESIGGIITRGAEGGYPIVPTPLELPKDQNFTFVLSEDFEIRIPFHQIFRPRQNPLYPGYIVRIVPLDDTIIPILGQPFLSSAYLTVSPSNSKFTLRPTLPTSSQTTKLIPLPTRGERNCSKPPPTLDPDVALDRAPVSKEDQNRSKIIAGSIGGFFAFLALTAGVIVFIITVRKRRKMRELLMGKVNAQNRQVGIGGRRFEDVDLRLPWDQNSNGSTHSRVGLAR